MKVSTLSPPNTMLPPQTEMVTAKIMAPEVPKEQALYSALAESMDQTDEQIVRPGAAVAQGVVPSTDAIMHTAGAGSHDSKLSEYHVQHEWYEPDTQHLWTDASISVVPPIRSNTIPPDSATFRTSNPDQHHGNSQARAQDSAYLTTRPTCSLNLVCYRSGATGCKLQQIHVAEQTRFKSDHAFKAACAARPDLLTSDYALLQALRNTYLRAMCGFWRRIFFLKTLRGIRLLEVYGTINFRHCAR